ncbi:hypothetical protein ILUMI_05087 [Ignelater luminosus]|uniref:Sodium/potassium-transporting ATPase subunit beta-2 n=1 Tax=Ignelater luminosus TaxID=2038154 RepID=A0A8K0D7R8_IGNLU|nr:hypothetical protein ILUMI_05087 [Ignelater luminosus]
MPPELGSNQFCDVRMDYWIPCNHNFGYNFNSSSGGPCIFLTLNKNPEWTPQYYNSSTVPDVMPIYIKERIRNAEMQYGANSNQLKVLWVSCQGENPADTENIGPIIYMPTLGFDGAYFPVINKERYLSPLVALYFEKPMRGVLISIQCKTWARNIKHENDEGSIHFELMID